MRYQLMTGLLIALTLSACYNYRWNTGKNPTSQAPEPISAIFEKHSGTIHLDAESPGGDYVYDVGEKDDSYGMDGKFRFTNVSISLSEYMSEGQVLANFVFQDDHDNVVRISDVDLLRLTPKIDAEGEMVCAELLLEEYNRFGLDFRKEHHEFEFETSDLRTRDKAYRANITNNCLAPGKWEFALTSEDYADINQRFRSNINLNQNKILTHTWFYLDAELYAALLDFKNPGKKLPLDMEYNDLSDRAEKVIVDFELLRRPIKHGVNTQLLEVGHQSNRQIVPVDVEEHYKWQYGLLLDSAQHTYRTILDQPLRTTQFQDRGYYTELTPKVFDLNWMQYMDQVKVDILDVKGSDAYAQFTLTGEWSPYNITIGNVDLAILDEQKLYGLLFGINTYPKSRRYNPVQSTIAYDAELLPAEIRPYVLLTDKQTGAWVNNQYKGIEKIYLTYNSLEQDVIDIYVLCYERITPVWMASIKLPTETREVVRVRKTLYNY
jgi:hypothetical protein